MLAGPRYPAMSSAPSGPLSARRGKPTKKPAATSAILNIISCPVLYCTVLYFTVLYLNIISCPKAGLERKLQMEEREVVCRISVICRK